LNALSLASMGIDESVEIQPEPQPQPAQPQPQPELDDLPDRSESVALAYVCGNQVAYSWHVSMWQLDRYDIANHGRIVRGGLIPMRHGSDGLVEARNRVIQEFLGDDRADWLFWVDTDMAFEPDTVDRLFQAADPIERPMVGALCFSQREVETDGIGGWRTLATPTVFYWAHDGDQQGFAVRWDYPSNTVVRCGGTGAACVLIHRSVFERVADKYGPIWYDRVPNTTTGQLVGEDLSFCLRVGALDIPIHVHTGVRTTHLKPVWLSEETYWRERALEPPPAKLGEVDG